MKRPNKPTNLFTDLSKNNIPVKVKANILQYVLLLSLFSLLLLGGFVGWVYYTVQTKRIQETTIHEQRILHEFMANLPNAVEIPLGEKAIISDLTTVDLELEIMHRYHGIFHWYGVKTWINKKSYFKSALYGDAPLHPSLSLLIPNNGGTLYLAEGAELSGTAFLSEGGIRQSSFGENNSPHSNPTISKIVLKKSTQKLPEMAAALKVQTEQIVNDLYWSPKTHHSDEKNVLFQSFAAPLRIIEFSEFKRIGSVGYVGNIWIRSTEPITIQASAVLKDVIISAPSIRIEDGFEGQIQAIASRSIHVGQNCTLNYPSALWVKAPDALSSGTESPKIVIESNSKVMGYVGYESKDQAQNTLLPDVSIAQDALVYGQVYVMGNTALKGEIQGALFTKNLIANHQGVVYKNHLFHGKIFPEKRAQEFVDFGWETLQNQKIMQWLY